MFTQQQLVYALSLQRHQNFHRAAEAVNISQPAFSRSIRNLEEELGLVLFDRNTGSVTPTSQGELILQRAKRVIEEAIELKREADLSKGPNFGEFSVAMGAYAAEISGRKAIAKIVKNHPNLSVNVHERGWQDVINQVLNRSVEVGYVNTEVIEKGGPLACETIAYHEPVFFCRDGHPLLKQSQVQMGDLKAYPVSTVRLPDRPRNQFPGMLRFDHKLGLPQPSIEVDNLTTARAAVAESDAFSLAAPVQIEDELRSGKFRVLPYRAVKYILRYGFITLSERTLSPAAEEFMAMARTLEAEISERNRELLKHFSPVYQDDESR